MSLGPRFGFDNLFYRYRDGVISLNEDADHPGLNALDWRPGTFWRGSRLPTLASNGGMLAWSGSPGDPPDGWYRAGTGETIAQVVDTGTEAPPYLCSVTRNGATTWISQVRSNATGVYRGRRLGVAMRARTSTAGMLRVQIHDSISFGTSGFHTGGGGFETLRASVVVGAGANVYWVPLLTGVDGTAEIDWVVVTELFFDETGAPNWGDVAPASLVVFPADGQLLGNWLYDEWPSDGVALPALWTAVTGAPAAVARFPTPKVGRYGLSMFGQGFMVGQEITGADLESIKGKRVWHGQWCASLDTRARVSFVYRMSDGSLTPEVWGTPGAGGKSHTGSGAWLWLSAYVDVPHEVTGVFPVMVHGGGANFTANWSGALFVQQDAEPSPTPHAQPVDYLAFASHDAGTTEQTVALSGSSDNFATSTPVLSVSPVDDKTQWADIEPIPGPVTLGAYRVKTPATSGPNAQALSIGVLSAGKYLQVPCPPQVPFAPLSRQFESELPKTRFGAPLGRSIPREVKQLTLTWQLLQRSFVVDDLLEWWWPHAGGVNGLPFFLQWSDDLKPSESFYVWLPDQASFIPQERVGLWIRGFQIVLEGLAE